MVNVYFYFAYREKTSSIVNIIIPELDRMAESVQSLYTKGCLFTK